MQRKPLLPTLLLHLRALHTQFRTHLDALPLLPPLPIPTPLPRDTRRAVRLRRRTLVLRAAEAPSRERTGRVLHDMLVAAVDRIVGHAERVAEALGALVAGLAAAPGGELVGMGVGGGGGGAAGEVLKEGVEHRHVVDEDGDEGFADGPFAGLFGAVGSGL